MPDIRCIVCGKFVRRVNIWGHCGKGHVIGRCCQGSFCPKEKS